MLQGQKRVVQSAESDDMTMCIISYISLHDYVLSLDLNLLLSNNFGYKILVNGVS